MIRQIIYRVKNIIFSAPDFKVQMISVRSARHSHLADQVARRNLLTRISVNIAHMIIVGQQPVVMLYDDIGAASAVIVAVADCRYDNAVCCRIYRSAL